MEREKSTRFTHFFIGYTRNALVLKILHDWLNQQNKRKDEKK